jgi:hypothetical protein
VDRGGPLRSSWASKTERVAAYGALTLYMLVLLGALFFIILG